MVVGELAPERMVAQLRDTYWESKERWNQGNNFSENNEVSDQNYYVRKTGKHYKKCSSVIAQEVMPYLLAGFIVLANLIIFNLLIAMFKYAQFHC